MALTITVQHVRYFLALCEECNFTRAAQRCGVRQPSLTSAIKHLEMEFGGPLFIRNRKTIRLSDLGTVVRPHLTVMECAAATARRDAAAFLAAGQVLPFKPKENAMRKVVYGAAIAAIVLLVVGVTTRPPQRAAASPPAQASGITDVYAIEATIDVKALPRYDVVSEAEE
jgi:Bacterial regulatory helix-turn-helix protein, lysR family